MYVTVDDTKCGIIITPDGSDFCVSECSHICRPTGLCTIRPNEIRFLSVLEHCNACTQSFNDIFRHFKVLLPYK